MFNRTISLSITYENVNIGKSKGGVYMHESEWFPLLLSKYDMLQICNQFNLSVPGFRKDRLSSRPEEQLRSVLTQALKNGIGAKKNGRGKLLTDTFFSEIIEKMGDLIKSEWKNKGFQSLVDDLDLSVDVRPYQKLALIREWFPDEYSNNVNQIRYNVIEKKGLFNGISKVNDSEYINHIIQELSRAVDIPNTEEYSQFIEELGATARWEQLKSALNGKQTDRERLMFISGLNSFDRFLGVVTLKDSYEPLQSVAFSLYIKEHEKICQSICKRAREESSAAIERTTKLIKEIEGYQDENTKLVEQIEALTLEIKRLKDRRLEDGHRENALRVELQELRTASDYAEQIKELFEELLPETNETIIITDKPDPRIKRVFSKSIFSKNFLLKEKQSGNIHNLKSKIWFIDRQSFRNTKEWVQIKQFLDESNFFYEEYNDYLELLRRYMQVIQSDDAGGYSYNDNDR